MRRRALTVTLTVLAVASVTLAVLALRFRPKAEREDPATVEREIVHLAKLRDSLRAVVYEAALTSDVLDGQPEGDVLIALPTPFVDAVVRSVVTGWFHDVDIRLPTIRLRKSGEVKARLGLLGRRTVGDYELAVRLDDVRGRLQPDVPELTFGGDVITMSVPVRVAGGTGVAHIKADWTSRGLARAVCGNMTAERDVTGQVRARTYIARGRIVLSAVDGAVLADPDFPGLALRLFIDPSKRSVAALDSMLDAHTGLCGFAVDKSRASERIQELVARGFNVKIPQRFFRPIRLPIAVETAVPLENRQLALQVTPRALSVHPSTIWISANVSLGARIDMDDSSAAETDTTRVKNGANAPDTGASNSRRTLPPAATAAPAASGARSGGRGIP